MSLTDWIKDRFKGNPCALPPHMKDMKHNDWPPGLKWVPRALNAYGARCPMTSPGYRRWPPRLVEGRGVARWETLRGDSIIYIPALAGVEITGSKVYGRQWLATEMNPGKANFLRSFDVFLADPRSFSTQVWDEPVPGEPGKFRVRCEPDLYSPSALQKFSRPGMNGYLKTDPEYHSEWRIRKQRELRWLLDGAKGKSPEDALWFFWRNGYRPDHVDGFYNRTAIATAGLKWE